MYVRLTENQIMELKNRAKIEVDREIYSIKFNSEEIFINDSWSITRNKNIPINDNIVKVIEEYCTKSNIDWEYNVEYNAWCN